MEKEDIFKVLGTNKELEDLQVWSWLVPGTQDFVYLVGSILASLSGGADLDGPFRRLAIGWQEVKMLAELLDAIKCTADVRDAVALFKRELGWEKD